MCGRAQISSRQVMKTIERTSNFEMLFGNSICWLATGVRVWIVFFAAGAMAMTRFLMVLMLALSFRLRGWSKTMASRTVVMPLIVLCGLLISCQNHQRAVSASTGLAPSSQPASGTVSPRGTVQSYADVVDRVAPAAPHTDHLDHRFRCQCFQQLDHRRLLCCGLP